MTILIISRGIPSEKYKTNGIFEYDQAKALAKAGHKVILGALDLRSIRRLRKFGISSTEKEGVFIRQLSLPLGNLPKTLFYTLSEKALSELYSRIVTEFGIPDVMHAHFTDLAYVAVNLKNCKNIKGKLPPIVVTEHSSLMNRKYDQLPEALKQAGKVAYVQADKLIAVSPALAGHIQENFGVEPVCIPDMVDTKLFCPPDQKQYDKNKNKNKDKDKDKDKKDEFRFFSMGNLLPNKRMALTIQAFEEAFREKNNVELDIYGGGPLREELELLIKSLKMEDRIHLKGLCTREEISEPLRQTDCFVLASASETFGVSYIEALASGVPVIATRCGGPEAYVTEENGLMIDVDDLQGLKEAMLLMYSRPEAYDRQEIARQADKMFSGTTVAEGLSDLYQVLLESKGLQHTH